MPKWNFSTPLIEGSFESDGHVLQSNVRKHDGKAIGNMLLPYRLLSRDGWHGEAREMPHLMTVLDNGIECKWIATLGSPMDMTMRTILTGAGVFDVTYDLRVHSTIKDFELFYSSYFDRDFSPGGYVQTVHWEKTELPGIKQVRPVGNEIFREMYVSFPRDERAAGLITDGRWQRGRHFTRFLPARYYSMPLGFFSSTTGKLSVSCMSSQEEVFAVNMAYRSDDAQDNVGHHNSLYLSLIGRTVNAGERVQGGLRMVISEEGDAPQTHQKLYREFLENRPKSARE